jgi:hypothetical protein
MPPAVILTNVLTTKAIAWTQRVMRRDVWEKTWFIGNLFNSVTSKIDSTNNAILCPILALSFGENEMNKKLLVFAKSVIFMFSEIFAYSEKSIFGYFLCFLHYFFTA